MKQDLLNNKCCEQRLLFANTRKMDKHITKGKTGGDPRGYGKDQICCNLPNRKPGRCEDRIHLRKERRKRYRIRRRK